MFNPISFRPGSVTFWTTLVYLALLIPIIVINETVPPAPSEFGGVDLNEAWLDLSHLTRGYHPYNSHYNDDVRSWLTNRTQQILDSNNAKWSTVHLATDPSSHKDGVITILDDNAANFTFLFSGTSGSKLSRPSGSGAQVAHFEGTNLCVYIPGTEDEGITWWDRNAVKASKYSGQGLTLVNAHYDSVSTGYGATDTGVGVITILQLIRYFSSPEHRPKKGIVALFNNGEEDFLYGARAFSQNPMMPYIHTFLNLEGAGAGGRALLFRTTDQEATAAYAETNDPFGTVISSDAFGLGAVRSQTDYVVLNGIYGQRGLDLAFYKPRSRYHTTQDDVTHTSRGALWHMLSASIHTTENLSGDMSGAFSGQRPDGARDKVDNGSPSDGVWFDLFGKSFVLFNLRGMFAWSLTILIAAPLILLLVSYLLHKSDKYYFFSSSVRTYDQPDYEPVTVGGWKGFFRFPFALGVAVALCVGAAFLLRKVNPLVLNSSRYTVWATFFSLFYFSFWAIMRGANFIRPSALHRGYVNIWLFIIGWALLVVVTAFEDRYRIAAGYIVVFLQSALFLSTLITLLELFALPKKTAWGQQVREDHEARDQRLGGGHHTDDLIAPTPGEAVSPHEDAEDDEDEQDEDEVPDESTPLVGGNHARNSDRVTFTTTYRRSISAVVHAARKAKSGKEDNSPFEHEQAWSGSLPSWTWWFQFLLLAPMVIILTAQAGLVLADSLNQTGYDGSDMILAYLLMLATTVLVILPLTPFIHRITYHIPVFLLVVFVATMIYNLAAFPYSTDARFVVFFQQTVDIDTGTTLNHYHGIEPYVHYVLGDIPSASGRNITCEKSGDRAGLADCSYDASLVKPNLGANFTDLVKINATAGTGNKATLKIDGFDTKACFVEFARPVSGLTVHGSTGWDDRFGAFPDEGCGFLRLWRRDRSVPWQVDIEMSESPPDDNKTESVEEPQEKSGEESPAAHTDKLKTSRAPRLEGRVICIWSDANTQGTIPAVDEALRFVPRWSAITPRHEGLIEGSKRFEIV